MARKKKSDPPVSLLKRLFLKTIIPHQKQRYQFDPIRSGIQSDPESGPIRSPIRNPILLLLTATFSAVLHKELESFTFEDEDEALCFRHNEIFKPVRLQLGRDDEVGCKNIVTPSLSRI